jgi:diacylglycerol kinase family enzyme
VALIPLGTGNPLARNLGVPTELDEALAMAVDGVDRRVDCGRVDDQPFAVMAGTARPGSCSWCRFPAAG